MTVGLTGPPGTTPAWYTASDHPLSSSESPTWQSHSGSSFWAEPHSAQGQERQGPRISSKTMRHMSGLRVSVHLTLPVWLRAWCAKRFPCSRPPESDWNANSQMPRGFLTWKKSMLVSQKTNKNKKNSKCPIFCYFCKTGSYLRCQKRKCPILLLDKALSSRKVVRSQSR